MPTRHLRARLLGLAVTVALVATACIGGDDGAGVREIGPSDEPSASASASASGSASAPAAGERAEATDQDGGYTYASNVDSHRLVVADLCVLAGVLDAGDFDVAADIYRDGINSVTADGELRTIAGFASRDDRRHGLDVYYETPTPLDDFISAALEGSGPFDGESDEVRAQGVEKGMQNQAMVAWVVHELASALAKAADGDFDVAEGAVHNWDEAWAFYHGGRPGCAPYATADKRAANFGTTGADGETAQANEAILAAMNDGRDALLAADVGGAEAAAAEVRRNLVIIYSQAAIRYAELVVGDLAEGDDESARGHQAEGLAFWRVIEAMVAAEGADVDAVNAVLDLANEPGVGGDGADVRTALEPAWNALGISADDIGRLS